MERSQYHEHSSPLNITSSFVFEDAEYMRASFVEEKNAIFTAALQTPILRNLFRKLLQLQENYFYNEYLHSQI